MSRRKNDDICDSYVTDLTESEKIGFVKTPTENMDTNFITNSVDPTRFQAS